MKAGCHKARKVAVVIQVRMMSGRQSRVNCNHFSLAMSALINISYCSITALTNVALMVLGSVERASRAVSRTLQAIQPMAIQWDRAPYNGALKIVEKEEYEKVTQRGYRSLVGTILWPARNSALLPLLCPRPRALALARYAAVSHCQIQFLQYLQVTILHR